MPSPHISNYGAITPTTATVTLTADGYAGQRIILDRAAGITFTLPAATGSGNVYEFIVVTTVTSNAYKIQVHNAATTIQGYALIAQDGGDTSVMFEAADDSDTIDMNGSTRGGVKGARAVLTDVKANIWHAQVISAGTGTEATPFTAAVS